MNIELQPSMCYSVVIHALFICPLDHWSLLLLRRSQLDQAKGTSSQLPLSHYGLPDDYFRTTCSMLPSIIWPCGDILKALLWLPVCSQMWHKYLIFKTHHGLAFPYLSALISSLHILSETFAYLNPSASAIPSCLLFRTSFFTTKH